MAGSSPFNVINFLSLNSLSEKHLGKTPLCDFKYLIRFGSLKLN